MELQHLHLAIFKILKKTTFTIFSNITSFLLASLSQLGFFKSPPPDSTTHIVILDGTSSSLLRVPIPVITSIIKNKVPLIPYSDLAHRHDLDEHKVVCMVCLDLVSGSDTIRKLVNCEHVFHRECLDRWVGVGHVDCPLCRSMLLPPKKLLSFIHRPHIY